VSKSKGRPTDLRSTYERTRSLTLEAQIRDCADQLFNPKVIVNEVIAAFDAMEKRFASEIPDFPEIEYSFDAVDIEEFAKEFFYSTRDVTVLGEPCAFTCLSSNVDPVVEDRRSDARDGLDFVGLTCNDTAVPVLGAVQSREDASAYPLLLRLLSCLTEMAPAPQIERINHQFFRGVLGEAPAFDLDIVLWDPPEDDHRMPLCQLTRDLAEQIKGVIQKRGPSPPVLRDIVCLRMNPERFDGRLRFEWRV
jgi:hypothetical protein